MRATDILGALNVAVTASIIVSLVLRWSGFRPGAVIAYASFVGGLVAVTSGAIVFVRLAALLRRSHAACMLPPRAWPDERLARKPLSCFSATC